MRRACDAGCKLLVVCLACMIGIVQVGCEKKPPKRTPFRMADADVAAHIKVAELLQSDFVKKLTEKAKALPVTPTALKETSPEEMIKSYLGIQASDIEFVSVSANTEKKSALGVLVSAVKIDSATVLANLSEQTETKFAEVAKHAEVGLYAGEGEDDVVMAFPGENTIVLGAPADVKGGLDNWKAGRSVEYGADLAGLLAGARAPATIVVAALPSADALKDMPMPALKGIKTVLLTARMGADLVLSVSLGTKDDASAKDLRDMVAGGIAAFKQNMPGEGAPPETVKKLAPIKELLDGVTVGGTGSKVEINATVNVDVLDAADALMPMMMMGLMGGMGGMGGPQGAPKGP